MKSERRFVCETRLAWMPTRPRGPNYNRRNAAEQQKTSNKITPGDNRLSYPTRRRSMSCAIMLCNLLTNAIVTSNRNSAFPKLPMTQYSQAPPLEASWFAHHQCWKTRETSKTNHRVSHQLPNALVGPSNPHSTKARTKVTSGCG